jgi:hypothetical protein
MDNSEPLGFGKVLFVEGALGFGVGSRGTNAMEPVLDPEIGDGTLETSFAI